jgi:hypothetical protein
MRALKFITGHVIYNPSFTYKFQLKNNYDYKFESTEDRATAI